MLDPEIAAAVSRQFGVAEEQVLGMARPTRAADLYDLCCLAQRKAQDAAAPELFARLGPTGQAPSPWMFDRAPSEADWTTQLKGQTRITVDVETALDTVATAWANAVD